MTDDDRRTQRRLRRRVTRVNKRLVRDVPLFVATGVVKTIDEARARRDLERHDRAVAAHFARLDAHRRRKVSEAAWLRAFVARLVQPAELRRLDEQRAAYPDSPEYSHDHWGQQLRRLDPALATACGYPPIEPSMPVNRLGGYMALRRGDADADKLRAYLDQRDEELRRQKGGEQLNLIDTETT